jgi:hypothetical protein
MGGKYPAPPPAEGTKRERREVRLLVPPALQDGWLAFQTGSERRRLAPIPRNWTKLNETELIDLLGRADRLTDGNLK